MKTLQKLKLSSEIAQMNKQLITQTKPKNDDPFIATKFAENLNILRVYNEATGPEDFVVISEDVVKATKFGAIQKKDGYVSKTESGIKAVHLFPKQTNNPWLKSGMEGMDAGCEGPVLLGRDFDANIYTHQRVTDAVIPAINDVDIEEATEATFADYIIDSIDHPALEGLLKKVDVPSPIQSEAVQPTIAPVKEVKNEFVLDMSELDLDVNESEFNLLDDAE